MCGSRCESGLNTGMPCDPEELIYVVDSKKGTKYGRFHVEDIPAVKKSFAKMYPTKKLKLKDK